MPDIEILPLDGEDFLVLACDGLWDSLSEEAVARAIYSLVMENPGMCLTEIFILQKIYNMMLFFP